MNYSKQITSDHKQFGMTLFYWQTISIGFGESLPCWQFLNVDFHFRWFSGRDSWLHIFIFPEILWQRCWETLLDLLRRCYPDVIVLLLDSWQFYVVLLDHQDFPADVPLRPNMPPNTAPASARTPRTVSVRWDGGWSGELLLQRWKRDSVTTGLQTQNIYEEDFIKNFSDVLFEPPVSVFLEHDKRLFLSDYHIVVCCRFEYKSRDKKHHRHIGKASNRSPWKNNMSASKLETTVICPYIISCSSHSGLFSIQGFSAGFDVFRVWEAISCKQKLICSLNIFQPKCWFEHSKKTCGWSFALRYWLKLHILVLRICWTYMSIR